MTAAGRAPRSRASLGIVYATVFIDLLGFGIILPVLPFYAERLGATGLWLGILLTSYSFAQLLGAALLGRLSDRLGRRPILLLSLAGSSLSLFLTGFAVSLAYLAAVRALAGLFGGSIASAQAYIADVTEPEERARFMGYLGAAIGLGFVLGPALGALLSPLGFGAAAFAAAGLAAGNLGLAAFKLSESLDAERRAARSRRAGWLDLAAALRHPDLGRILAAGFLTMFAFVGMETTLAYLGDLLWGLEERSFGLLLVLVGAVAVAVQGSLIGPLAARFGERRLASGGAALMALTLVLLPTAPSLTLAALLLALMAAGRGLSLPALSSLLSRHSAPAEQGTMLGFGQSLAAAARAAGPLLAGWLYDQGPARPYLLAAALSLLAALAVMGLAPAAPAPLSGGDRHPTCTGQQGAPGPGHPSGRAP